MDRPPRGSPACCMRTPSDSQSAIGTGTGVLGAGEGQDGDAANSAARLGGWGTGAAAFAAVSARQVAISGLAGISLEEYVGCVGSQLVFHRGQTTSVRQTMKVMFVRAGR